MTCTHRLRTQEGRAAFEFEFSIGNAQRITFYTQPTGWAPMTWRNEAITAVQLAGMAGMDEAQAAAEIEAAAAMCEAEFIKSTGPALRAVA
ncbi:MAG: hypothetical protein B7X30_00995 [Thiomonas sp. 13-64-67]|nr:MAG: hypothetical protein B7X30_00995 [Thiomonas sp. 13-64-67]